MQKLVFCFIKSNHLCCIFISWQAHFVVFYFYYLFSNFFLCSFCCSLNFACFSVCLILKICTMILLFLVFFQFSKMCWIWLFTFTYSIFKHLAITLIFCCWLLAVNCSFEIILICFNSNNTVQQRERNRKKKQNNRTKLIIH